MYGHCEAPISASFLQGISLVCSHSSLKFYDTYFAVPVTVTGEPDDLASHIYWISIAYVISWGHTPVPRWRWPLVSKPVFLPMWEGTAASLGGHQMKLLDCLQVGRVIRKRGILKHQFEKQKTRTAVRLRRRANGRVQSRRWWGAVPGDLPPYLIWELVCLCAHSRAQSCSSICDPLDCCPPGSSVRGILHSRVLQWIAISSSTGSFPTQGWNLSPTLAGRFFTAAPPGKPWELLSSL